MTCRCELISGTLPEHERTMLSRVYQSRSLVWAFMRRDVSVRYRTSVLGWLWSLAQPLATLLLFFVVFYYIFHAQAPPLGNGRGSSYPIFIFCGLVTWNLFAGMQPVSITTMESCAELLGKVHFPGWAPVLGAQLVQALQILLEFVVLLLVLLCIGNVSWTWLLAIPILLGTVLFAMGIGLLISALSAHFGDVKEGVTTALLLLYFATPIMYPISMLHGRNAALSFVVHANPMSWYVNGVHNVLYSLVAPSVPVLIGLLAAGALTFWTGLVVFDRASRDLVELL